MSDETITDEYLDRLQAICDAATEGPWEVEDVKGRSNVLGPIIPAVLYKSGKRVGQIRIKPSRVQVTLPNMFFGGSMSECDADFTAESRTALPLLIAEVRRLRGEVASSMVDVSVTPGESIRIISQPK